MLPRSAWIAERIDDRHTATMGGDSAEREGCGVSDGRAIPALEAHVAARA